MGILKTGISAIGKLLIVVALAGTFIVGVVSVIYLSLRGEEVKVPEVVGKDFNSSESEIAALGLKMKKRATRYSEEKPNTVLEQLPKAGETVKTGQTISVVVSEANPEGSEAPATVKKSVTTDEEDESTDVTPDKPVKSNKNTNTKKPAQSTRDVIANKPPKNSNTSTSETNSTATPNNSNSKSEGSNKNTTTAPSNKSQPPNSNKTETVKPPPAKTPNGGDTRTRKVP